MYTLAGDRLEAFDALETNPAILRALDDGLRKGVLACAFEAGDEPERLAFADPTLDNNVHQLRLAQCQGPGLVHDECIELSQLLHGLGITKQDAIEGALTHCDG